jgi:hypothetical protein
MPHNRAGEIKKCTKKSKSQGGKKRHGERA